MKINDKLHTGECCRVCTPEKKEANGGLYCHGKCPDYLQKKKEADEFKALCKKNKNDYERVTSYMVDMCKARKGYKQRIRTKKGR